MDDLDLLLKKEIPIQAPPDDTLQVVIPVNPKLLGLPPQVRFDESVPRNVLDSLAGEYEEDVARYIAGAGLSDEISSQLRIGDYIKFSNEWRFAFRKGHGFLDLVWDSGGKAIEMGYMWAPVAVANYFTQGKGRLATPEDMALKSGDMGFILWYVQKGDPDLILFQKEKLRRFRHPDFAFYAEDPSHVEAAVPAFASTHTFNAPQALLLRSFGVKYLNALLTKLQKD